MKARVLCGVIASLTLVAGGVSVATSADRVAVPRDPAPRLSVAPPAAQSDAERRARLNERIQEMVRTGKGARLEPELVEPRRQSSLAAVRTRPPARPSLPSRTTAVPESQPARGSVTANESAPPSTIAPPTPVSRPARATGRARYVPPTLDLQTRPRIPTSDLECLTQAVYYEARNESAEGQAAVAEVVMNRAGTGRYPKGICDVVYQRNSRTCQFTFTCDGSIGRGPVNLRAWARAEQIARTVHEGRAPTVLPRDSVNYHANYVRPSWGRRLARVRQIGAHIFYGSPLDGGQTPGQEGVAAQSRPTGGLQFVHLGAPERKDPAAPGQARSGADAGA